jgi:hypothetical protein
LKKTLLLYPIFLLLILVNCKDREGGHTERAYTVEGMISVDSTVILDRLVLYTDRHVALDFDSIDLTPQHTFEHQGTTHGLNELFLCSDGGELCRFYATGNCGVLLKLTVQDEKLKATFDPSQGDSINPWLQEQTENLAQLLGPEKKRTIDSLCHLHPTDVRPALLLRDHIEVLNDSIFVRRCLGAFGSETVPDWLIKSIDQILDDSSRKPNNNRRLSPCTIQTDSTTFDFSASRSDYLLVYIWSDYSQSSIDSLKVVAHLVNEEYDMKRLQLVTLCLASPDSIWWKQQTQDIDGLHTWLPAGFSDERMRKWNIKDVPTVIVCDMYNNQQLRNEWGQKLRATLGRIPNRSSFPNISQPKPKANRGR